MNLLVNLRNELGHVALPLLVDAKLETIGPAASVKVEEVTHKLKPTFGQDRFGVVLDSLDRELAMADALDAARFGGRRHLKDGRE